MVRLAVDECVDNDIVRGVLRSHPTLDVLRVQDVGLSGASDREVLAWAAREQRILVTHDVGTMVRTAYDRTTRGEGMPGVVAIRAKAPIRAAIEDLLLVTVCHQAGELEGHVLFLPFG